jgi:hypothetical protein
MKSILITDSRSIANAFNSFFVKVGVTLTDAAPAVTKSPYDYLNQQQLGSFYLSSVTQTEIENEINQVRINKSVGPYSIPVRALKSLRHSLSKPLEILFNLSFTTGTVPEQFKIANVIPVFKTGSRTCVNNYRPISLLSRFNKLFVVVVVVVVVVETDVDHMEYGLFGICNVGFFHSDFVVVNLEYLRGIGHRVF